MIHKIKLLTLVVLSICGITILTLYSFVRRWNTATEYGILRRWDTTYEVMKSDNVSGQASLVFREERNSLSALKILPHSTSDTLNLQTTKSWLNTNEQNSIKTTEEYINHSLASHVAEGSLHDFFYGLIKTDKPPRSRRFISLSDEGLSVLGKSGSSHSELWSNEPFLNRRKELQERCKMSSLHRIVDLSRMVFDDKHKVVMCVVPKAACTTWKRIMWYLLGNVKDKADIKNINSNIVTLGTGPLRTLASLPRDEALKRLMTYTSFFIMRHPFERLVSAHSSKFTNRSKSVSHQMHTGRSIAYEQASDYLHGLKITSRNSIEKLNETSAFHRLNASEKEAVMRYIDVMNTGKISFQQFARFVASESNSIYARNVHWRPQVSLCNPCAVNYDVVIKFENLAKESNQLMKYIQRRDPEEKQVMFDESLPPLIDTSKTEKAFSTLDIDVISQLTKLYENDFQVLGYDSMLSPYFSSNNK